MPDRWLDLSATDRTATAPQWRATGMSRRAVPRELIRSSHGRYRLGGDDGPAQRIADAAALLPVGAVIGGWAAAWMHGVDLLPGRDEVIMRPQPVDVLLPPGGRRRSVPGIRYRQVKRPVPANLIAGIPVTPVRLTVRHLARWAPDLTSAVVAVDSLLGAELLTADQASAELSGLCGGRGCVQAREVAELCRDGVRSPWETRTRLFCERELAFPRLIVNEAVFDVAGRFLGIPDLLDEEAGLAIEYDGARWLDGRGHREPAQHRQDNVREEGLERTGLLVVRVERADLTRHRRELERRLRSAQAQGLRRDRALDRWTRTPPPGWTAWPA